MNEVDEYFLDLNPRSAGIAKYIRTLILASVPQVQESLKYGVPFYDYKGPMLYLSIYEKHVVLGFVQGVLVYDEKKLLTGEQKQVRHLIFRSVDDYDDKDVVQLIAEATMVNQTTYQ